MIDLNEFLTIEENSTAEIVEKKSRFIAHIFYIENIQQAENLIKEIKKKYHDARHNCMAFRVIENENIIEKSSDDGEPSGTAGAPMLEILKNKNICNVVVIVTRYFGGILLGTGGLVRAYSQATLNAIENSKKVYKCIGYEMELSLDYKDFEYFKHYCKKNNIKISTLKYLDVVVCKIELEKEIKEKIINDIDTKKINAKINNNLCKKIINKNVEK